MFSRNGTFLVCRKLHQNVASFNAYLEQEGAPLSRRQRGARREVRRALAQRRALTRFPTEAEANQFVNEVTALQALARGKTATPAERARLDELKLQFVAFDYDDDLEGTRCPFGSHTRRTESAQRVDVCRERRIRPAGVRHARRVVEPAPDPPSRAFHTGWSRTSPTDDGDHGVIMIILNADLSRQFEFVQQQWINFGNDFRLANDKDPLLGNHGIDAEGRGAGRMVIEGDARDATRRPISAATCRRSSRPAAATISSFPA